MSCQAFTAAGQCRRRTKSELCWQHERDAAREEQARAERLAKCAEPSDGFMRQFKAAGRT